MPENLYVEWLSLPPGPTPPDHYTLLGLPLFTDDRPAVEQAARNQLTRLDRYAMHPDPSKRDACHRMMNEVAKARNVLTSPERREAYDRELGNAKLKEVAPTDVAASTRLRGAIGALTWPQAMVAAAIVLAIGLIGYRLLPFDRSPQQGVIVIEKPAATDVEPKPTHATTTSAPVIANPTTQISAATEPAMAKAVVAAATRPASPATENITAIVTPAPIVTPIIVARTETLILKAYIDGSDVVRITPQGATWTHKNWGWPNDVFINGIPWTPQSDPEFESSGPLAFLRDLDFSTASVSDRSGRDIVTMEKTAEGIDVYFADTPNGGDPYEITIKIRRKAGR